MTVIPCKRPKVTVDQREPAPRPATFDVNCHVPGCRFTYPEDKRYIALKSDAEDQAARHRRAHRDAVPVIQIDKLAGGGHRASCQCRAIASEHPLTKTDADAWSAYHLSSVHGLVSC